MINIVLCYNYISKVFGQLIKIPYLHCLNKAQLQRKPLLATSPFWPLDAPVWGRRWARAADGRVRARGPRPLRMRRRAIEAERDPVPHAAVDSQTRSAQTVAARQRRRSVLSPRALCFLTQTRATYEEEICRCSRILLTMPPVFKIKEK